MAKKTRNAEHDEPAKVSNVAGAGAGQAAGHANTPLHAALAPLVDRLRSGKCVLWAGSGLDEAAGGVGFRTIVERMLATIPASDETREANELLAKRPFLVAGFVKRRLGSGFAAALKAAATGPKDLPAEIKLLGEMPFRAVLTTGFSDLLRRGFTHGDDVPTVYTGGTIAKREGRPGRFLLKALGDPETDEHVVFSAKDLQALLGNEALAATVRDFYRNRSILFIGVDPPVDVDRLFVRLLQGSPTEGVEHYAVLPGYTKLEREELESSYRLKIIDESDVLAVIRALRELLGDHVEALPDDHDLEAWMALLSTDHERADGLEKVAAIEKEFAKQGDHEKLLELHLGMSEIEGTAVGRAHRLREVARIFEQHLGDPQRAFTALLAAFKEHPADDDSDGGATSTGAELDRLAESTGLFADLVTEFTQLAPSLPAALRPGHWVRLARIYSSKLGDQDHALHAVDEALKLDPANKAARRIRASILGKSEKWSEAAAALEAIAAKEEDKNQKCDLYLEAGDILESRLSDAAGAVKAYRAALAADPSSSDALSALELLFRRRGEWKELVAVLDDKARAVPADRALEMRVQAASLLADKLGDRKGAIARLEKLRSDGGGLAVLRIIDKLYAAEGRHDEYLEALGAQADAATDPVDKASFLRRLGAEWEGRDGGRAHAAAYFEKLLALDPKAEDGYRAVERIYSADKKWEALVDALRRHADVAPADRLALFTAAAEALENEVKDAPRALDAWQQVLKVQADSERALGGLTRAYEATGAYDKALALLDKRAEHAKDKDDKTKLLHESGRLALDRLGDPKLAEARYHRAIEVDHTHVPSLTAMVELYRKSGEFLRAAKLLIEAETYTANRLDKTRLLVEAGELYDSIDEHETATTLYLRALTVDPEHVEAANRVGELLWKAERFAELVPVLEMLARKDADKATTKTRNLRLGKAALAIGQSDKAARAYVRAAEIDPTDVEAQRACGEIFFADGNWEDAREAFKAVLSGGGDELAPAARVDLYFRLGECDRKLGEIDKAKNFYAKALEIDPTHRPTILARIDVDGDDPKKIIEAKRALIATASDAEKLKLLTEIGDLSQEKLKNNKAAAEAWRQALQIQGDSRRLLHKLLDAYVEQQSWTQSLEMLDRLTVMETVPAIRAKLRFTSAMIHLEELQENEPAVKLLVDASDDDPSAAKIGERLEELLLHTENWKELQRYYRRLIKRMPPEAETDAAELKAERLRLWSALADVSIDKLAETSVGVSALEVTTGLEPGNVKRREQLAELYVQAGPDHADKAIVAHQGLLRAHHDRIASFRALRQLYSDTKQVEKALSVAYALSFLKKGTPEDEALVDEAKKRPFQMARRNLDDDLWMRCLIHPDEDRWVSALFSALLPTMSVANAKPISELGLGKATKVEASDARAFAKALGYVAGTLNVTLPYEVYAKPEQRDAITIENAVDAKPAPTPSSVIVVGQPLLADKMQQRELVFELTKRLAYFRSDRYLRHVLHQNKQLALVIDAAVALANELGGEKPAGGDIGKSVQELKRSLSPKALDAVSSYGRKLKSEKSDAATAAWLAAAELTATRAAFLLVGDLESTARLVAAEPSAISSHPAVYRLKELIWFSVTEECHTLKKHLGLIP